MYLIIAVYCRFLTGRKWGLEFAFHEKTRGLVHGLKSFLYPHDCCAAGLCLTQVWKLKSLEGWVYGNILQDLFLRSCQTDGWAGRIILIGLIILCLCIKHIQNRFLEITISYTRYRVQYLHASFVLAILGPLTPVSLPLTQVDVAQGTVKTRPEEGKQQACPAISSQKW